MRASDRAGAASSVRADCSATTGKQGSCPVAVVGRSVQARWVTIKWRSTCVAACCEAKEPLEDSTPPVRPKVASDLLSSRSERKQEVQLCSHRVTDLLTLRVFTSNSIRSCENPRQHLLSAAARCAWSSGALRSEQRNRVNPLHAEQLNAATGAAFNCSIRSGVPTLRMEQSSANGSQR